jgi:hypothetical protein
MKHILTKTLDQAANNVLKGFALQYDLNYYGEFDPLQHVLIDTAGGTYIEVTIFDLCNALDNKTPVEDVYRWIVQCESKYVPLCKFL